MIARFLTLPLACCLALSSAGAAACAQQGGGGRGPGGPGGPPMGRAPGMPPPGGGFGRNVPRDNAPNRPASITTRSGIKLGPPGRWWDDSGVSRQIGLSRDQQKRMDAIFQTSKPGILDSYKTFTAEQARLSAITRDPKSDQAQVFAAIDSVNQARSSLEKATMQMLLQVRAQLDPAQLTKLDALP